MDYDIKKDIKFIREILGITQLELADLLGIQQITISRNEKFDSDASERLLEQVYKLAYEKDIKLNKLKEMLWKDALKPNHKLLFHGAKSRIKGALTANKSRDNNDFGKGFYAGENYEQSISFISSFDKPSVYFLDLNENGLTFKKFNVNQEWMMTIAYFRGALDEYKSHPKIKNLINNLNNYDYIIAPIADNRMYQIINSFIEGEITDMQCKHCLSATNLGFQYVFLSEKSLKNLKIVERCYVSSYEKEYFRNLRLADVKVGNDKVKIARMQYRGQGRYIDEILKK